MTMDAETARQERIMGIRRIVRKQKEIIAERRERAASRQRGATTTYKLTRCASGAARTTRYLGKPCALSARCTTTRCAAVRSKRRGGRE